MQYTVAATLLASWAISVSAATTPHGCSLSEQVRLCVNHTSMQRSTCASDNFDCQCTWASEATMCFAPCVSDKEFSDGMHAARGDQETACAQAAKFGQAAKDKERQKQDEKKNKGKKQEKEVWTTTGAKDMNDLNATHDSVKPADPRGQAKPTAGPKHVDAGKDKKADGDKDVNVVESAAPSLAPMVPGILAILATILTI
ncbi:hypothetical protein GGH96_000869 [Coemansia sp. RSA 1972]|nr:hypothetical protein GGH96_000869 [Coemansia sp. RSA 1972]